MVESVVNIAMEKLSTFLSVEAELLGSLSKDVRDLQMELGSIKAVLNNAERKSEEDDTINEWLMQVREVAYNIEDVIDEYLLLKQQQKHQQQQQKQQESYQQILILKYQFILMTNRIRKWLRKAIVCVSQLRPKHELASKIKDIKTDITEISTRRERYRFSTTTEDEGYHDEGYEYLQDPRVSSLFMDDSEVVGIEDRKAVLFQLMNFKMEERLMIAMVGMGGIGKTTLARKVYEQVRKDFDVYAWVTVSQSYKRRDLQKLLKSIFNQMQRETSLEPDASEESIISILRTHLQDKSYIIVFDDVWDIELWRLVKATLPSNNKGSRILMTTRENNIALEWEASLGGHVFDLKPLPKEEAWDLFIHKIFGKGQCPHDLEESARDMVKKCKGLPLAIVAIAGLLSTKKKVPFEWNKMRNSIDFELGRNRRLSSTKRILLLSYYELPYYLKPCFLYFCMFPKGFSINGNKLFRVWIAEGFIQNQQGKTLEDVAEDFVNELVNRSLVEVDMVNENILKTISKRNRLYKVHDILREMIIIPKTESLGFCLYLGKESDFSTTKHFRRFSIDPDFTSKSVLEVLNSSSTRSLLSVSNFNLFSESYLNSILRVARLLKVLDLEDALINHFPEELGNLQHLRYLSLRNTDVQVLPKSIGNLRNLQTIDLKRSLLVELPKEIAHCHNLRHLLIGNREMKAVNIQDGMLENFKELQKLACVAANKVNILDELWHLKYLRRLQITKLRKEHGMQLCRAIEEMKLLRSLSLESMSFDEILDIQHITSPPLLLERLYLGGLLVKLPGWIAKLNNLTSLYLISSRLKDDPLTTLQGIPNLVGLTLDDAYVGENLNFGFTSFSKLVKLYLLRLHNLQSVAGSLPSLQSGEVDDCPVLQSYSESIKELMKLSIIRKIRAHAQATRAALLFKEAGEKLDQQ
ncbi:disease resistance protein RPM1-like [Spinacia oleracea]|uniref:Disease resistance protein RPM1-like n=1 Tax=Spinacia oleracea TaxID=3562 RepID=A0A9R0J8Q3_SPIOL|nr:disease resistance protein RPM1-like [Spinacia oleracea]